VRMVSIRRLRIGGFVRAGCRCRLAGWSREPPGSMGRRLGRSGRTVVYARVSSHDQRADLDRQVV
jgi:predicted site-specific integrase-resolvase